MGKFRKSISTFALILVVWPGSVSVSAALTCEPPEQKTRQFSAKVGILVNEAVGFMNVEGQGRGAMKMPIKIEAMLWQAWSQAEQYDRALPWAEKWFETAEPKERQHFDLLYFLYRELEMRDKNALIIKQMYARWPEDKSIKKAYLTLNCQRGKLLSGISLGYELFIPDIPPACTAP